MPAKELNFDTGLQEYTLNKAVSVWFNPTDNNFVSRMYDVFEELDKKQEAYKAEIAQLGESKEIFEFARARDNEMRQIIDDLFGQPICEALFGHMNVYALDKYNMPIWANLLLTVIDEIGEAVERASDDTVTNARLEKYIAKYRIKK